MFARLSASILMIACAGLTAAELTVGKSADLTGGVKGELSDTKDGIRFTGKNMFFSRGKLEIDPSKSYEVSFRVRAAEGAKTPGNCYIGIKCFNASGREIPITHVNALAGTETELAAPAKRGDLVLKVKDASKWTARYAHAAFNVKKDLSDLPNPDISPSITKIEKKGQVWELTLKTPLSKDYPAGTAVRRHADSNTFIYVCGNLVPGKEWKNFSFTFSGLAKSEAANAKGKFRAGTKSVQFVVFPGSIRKFDLEIAGMKIAEKAVPAAKK